MRVFKIFQAAVPFVCLAGFAMSAFAGTLSKTPETPATPVAKMNPESAKIASCAIPFFGAAFPFSTISSSAEYKFGLPVIFIKEGSPAENAGLRVGDILLTFDGQKLFFPNQFAALLRTYGSDDSVKIEFLRDGELRCACVRLCPRAGTAVRSGNRAGAAGIFPQNEKDDIRIIINGREFALSENQLWGNLISVTPDSIVIHTGADDVPASLKRLVEAFRKHFPDPIESARRLECELLGVRAELLGHCSAASQVYFADGKTVMLTCENDKRDVTVRTADKGEIFRGSCATQEEIDAIPADVREIIEEFTTLMPVPKSPEKNVFEKTKSADKK